MYIAKIKILETGQETEANVCEMRIASGKRRGLLQSSRQFYKVITADEPIDLPQAVPYLTIEEKTETETITYKVYQSDFNSRWLIEV